MSELFNRLKQHQDDRKNRGERRQQMTDDDIKRDFDPPLDGRDRRVDVYEGPRGDGFTLLEFESRGRERWHRTEVDGPEKRNREFEWTLYVDTLNV